MLPGWDPDLLGSLSLQDRGSSGAAKPKKSKKTAKQSSAEVAMPAFAFCKGGVKQLGAVFHVT